MNTLDKIKEIENEMARTQKNKATSFHIGVLKARIAKLRREFMEPPSKSGTGEGFDVSKTGVARIGFIGFPSVGKSTLMSALTGTYSEVAEYEFTTLTTVPGILYYNNAKIQILDLPGIIEGAKDNKGRGRQVLAVARTCSLLVIVLDATKPLTHKKIIERELEGVGIRINRQAPDIKVVKKDRGGINLIGGCLKLEEVQSVLSELRIHNADVIIKGDVTIDDLIDVVEGNRKYVPALWVLNKIDKITLEELDILSQLPNCVPLSSNCRWNFDTFLESAWEKLDIIRVYPKPRGQKVSDEPVVLRGSKSTVADFCNTIHKSILSKFKYAKVWGSSVKHHPQKVGKTHQLHDGDVIQISKSV
eukprot:jgi/Antlo1/122/1067